MREKGECKHHQHPPQFEQIIFVLIFNMLLKVAVNWFDEHIAIILTVKLEWERFFRYHCLTYVCKENFRYIFQGKTTFFRRHKYVIFHQRQENWNIFDSDSHDRIKSDGTICTRFKINQFPYTVLNIDIRNQHESSNFISYNNCWNFKYMWKIRRM